jgi:hypothetical protein
MSSDVLFENLDLNGSDPTNVIRYVVELTFFENRFEREKFKPSRVLRRVRQLLGLGNEQSHPSHLEKLVHVEFSNLCRRKCDAKDVAVHFLDVNKPKIWLVDREKLSMLLPITAFERESKKRIFSYLATPIREDIRELQDMRSQLVNADKLIKKLTNLLQTLARQFDVRESINTTDKVAYLRASIAAEKTRYEALKQQFEHEPQSEDTKRFENRLKQAQKQLSTLNSELQKLIRETVS